MRILIVDDSRAMRGIISRMLRQIGYDEAIRDEAGNGREALEAIRRAPPDLVIADWNMPEMTGWELFQAIRADGLNTPFGFVTAESVPEVKQAAFDAGALFFLTKPLTRDVLEAALREALP